MSTLRQRVERLQQDLEHAERLRRDPKSQNYNVEVADALHGVVFSLAALLVEEDE